MSDIDALQLATWNDFGEGTMFEPTLEFGFTFLRTLQQRLGVPYGGNELYQVYRLFELRRLHADNPDIQDKLDEVFDHLVALEVREAVAAMNEIAPGSERGLRRFPSRQ